MRCISARVSSATRKAEIGEARHEARRTQYPHRVFDEGLAHVAQHAGLHIARTAEGIDQHAIRILRDGVDGEVAPGEILLQADVGRGMHHEAAVAAPGLALGACQRVLLAGFGVQEHREVLAHRAESACCHLLGRGTDHDEITIAGRDPEQAVPHRATDQKNLHVHVSCTLQRRRVGTA
jgi:hypothetical protein